MRSVVEGNSADSVLHNESSTFTWASFFFSSRDKKKLSKLYAFCRYLDNIADDDIPPSESRTILKRIKSEIENDPENEKNVTGHVESFLDMSNKYGLRRKPVLDLIQGLLSDLGTVRINSKNELIRYCYQVAGTVGLMINDLFGVESEADTHAVSLGIAMQLSNISRDLREDFEKNRIYVPSEFIEHRTVKDAMRKRDRESIKKLRKARSDLVQMADEYYRYAEEGIHYLPIKIRPGILAASRCYELIGTNTENYDPVVNIPDLPVTKIRLCLTAFVSIVLALIRFDFNGVSPNQDRSVPQMKSLKKILSGNEY